MHALSSTAFAKSASFKRVGILVGVLAIGCLALSLLVPTHALRGVGLMPVWMHTAIELSSVVVAMLVFGVAWNGYSRERSGNIIILGCVLLAVGLLDLGHLMSYQGMPPFITPSSPSKAINFWLAARLIAALALLAVALRAPRPFAIPQARFLLLGASLAVTALIYAAALLRPEWWPETFIDGVGLTATKIALEWIIIAILAPAAILFYRRARHDGSREAAGLFGVASVTILSELCFTVYINVTDIFNLLGHALKILADLFLYKAVFVASVREPFSKLRIEVGERMRAEAALRELNLELEQRVAQRTMQLEQANRELESFSYSVSHDLRAPLRAIDGFSQLLTKHYGQDLDTRGKDYLQRVRNATRRMGELIDDILHLSHIGRQELVRSRVDLTLLAQDIADGLRQSDCTRKAQFIIAPGLSAEADPRLARIVLENLMGNAWKFTAKKPETVIEVGTTMLDGGRAIFVRDNGAGFSMDYAHKLFNVFQRLHSASDFEGSGIGLATVQRIVHRHGGRTLAEGREGEGATFYVLCKPPQEEKRDGEQDDDPAG